MNGLRSRAVFWRFKGRVSAICLDVIIGYLNISIVYEKREERVTTRVATSEHRDSGGLIAGEISHRRIDVVAGSGEVQIEMPSCAEKTWTVPKSPIYQLRAVRNCSCSRTTTTSLCVASRRALKDREASMTTGA